VRPSWLWCVYVLVLLRAVVSPRCSLANIVVVMCFLVVLLLQRDRAIKVVLRKMNSRDGYQQNKKR
jgi:hypothetical protein